MCRWRKIAITLKMPGTVALSVRESRVRILSWNLFQIALVNRGRCPNYLTRLILLIQQNHDWFVRRQLRLAIAGIRADNQDISDGRLARRRAVQRNLPRTPFRRIA